MSLRLDPCAALCAARHRLRRKRCRRCRDRFVSRACDRDILPPDRGGDVSGFVSFVSAGPGDPELLTFKAQARLRDADVVLYDDLAAGAILDHARPGASLVAVGKRAGHPSAKQEHVSRLLVDYAATGVSVVRLKSGDAGIFGRLEEELDALQSAGIAYEIIPGVTAACAAAAISRLPLTRRHTPRRVEIVTRPPLETGVS